MRYEKNKLYRPRDLVEKGIQISLLKPSEKILLYMLRRSLKHNGLVDDS